MLDPPAPPKLGQVIPTRDTLPLCLTMVKHAGSATARPPVRSCQLLRFSKSSSPEVGGGVAKNEHRPCAHRENFLRPPREPDLSQFSGPAGSPTRPAAARNLNCCNFPVTDVQVPNLTEALFCRLVGPLRYSVHAYVGKLDNLVVPRRPRRTAGVRVGWHGELRLLRPASAEA